MDKDNKRGFSGLSYLTSDTRTFPQSQPRQASPQPSPSQKPVFALLELTKWPTLPAPWSGVDAGETWVWGDFFLTFQKKPKTVFDLTMEMQGEKAEYRGMTYYYVTSVFYRIGQVELFRDAGSAVGSKRPAKDDRRPGAGAWASGNGAAHRKEKLWIAPR